ncbi:UNVERIFIED_CONTAM: hypothetical protein GTU68_023149 [Idotea baltica]|nr:hypothetical protein [Idotea baltica]
MVIAKTEEAMTFLSKQFYDRTVDRRYVALVWGDVEKDEGSIEGHIGRHARFRQKMDVYPDGDFGKAAKTNYKVLQRFGYVTLVECKLETGRTHQIRAHFKYLGHPLFSDDRYGGDQIILPRQALHARTIGFVHPNTGETMHFESPIPEDIAALLDKWKRYMGIE